MNKPESDSKNLEKQVRQSSNKSKGSLSIIHKEGDLVENTIGRIGAIPTNLVLGTPSSIFENIPQERVAELQDRFKNVNWQGKVEVYLNHSPLFRQLKRLFEGDRRASIFGRVLLGIPSTIQGWLLSKLFRSDYYNPFTETVTTYLNKLPVAAHEIGHAVDYDKSQFPSLRAFFGHRIPILGIYQEWKASNYAMKHLNTDERIPARKILEPAWGTYLGAFTGAVAAAIFPPSPLFVWAPIIGAVTGHIYSRLPGTKNLFFNDKSVESIQNSNPVNNLQSLRPAYAHA